MSGRRRRCLFSSKLIIDERPYFEECAGMKGGKTHNSPRAARARVQKAPMHRADIGPSERSDYLWCLHCCRAYKWGEYRVVNGLQMCPYDGCSGDTVLDGWTWPSVRKGNRGYPRVPKLGHVYELYRTSENIDYEFRRYQQVARFSGGLLPQATAATVLGLSKQRINDLVADGRLREHEFFGKNFIACSDIEAFKRKDRRHGRPRKANSE